MKNVTALATAALIASSIAMSTASANDNKVPEILGAMTDTEIQALSVDEASDTRGERVTVTVGYRPGLCGWKPCLKPIKKSVMIEVGRRGGPSYYVKH